MWHVTSFYQFLALGEPLSGIREKTAAFMEERAISGLIVFAPEGVNGTVAGEEAQVLAFKSFLSDLVGFSSFRFKDSVCNVAPFHRTSVVIRPEIVGMKRPDLVPIADEDHHLSPSEWHELLSSGQPRVVIDTRNDYEVQIGKFEGAVDPGLKSFSHWGDYAEQAEIPRDVPVLIYCTGGIRCEKVMVDMRSRGYDNVYQLRDGILGYLAEYPDGFYEGECFVFDDRVAVDAHLQPSKTFGICPACGLPSNNHRTCARCEGDYVVCPSCEVRWNPVCSKTCDDRYRRHGILSLASQLTPSS